MSFSFSGDRQNLLNGYKIYHKDNQSQEMKLIVKVLVCQFLSFGMLRILISQKFTKRSTGHLYFFLGYSINLVSYIYSLDELNQYRYYELYTYK